MNLAKLSVNVVLNTIKIGYAYSVKAENKSKWDLKTNYDLF